MFPKRFIWKILLTALWIGSTASLAQDVAVEITADNAYGFGFGVSDRLCNYSGAVENRLAGEIFNCNGGPESYVVPEAEARAGRFLYVVAWADKAVTQGVLGQLQAGANPPIYTGVGPWEVCATGIDFDPVSGGPTRTTIDAEIVRCNEGTGDPLTTSAGWVDAVGTAVGKLAAGEPNDTQRVGGVARPGNEFPITCQARIDAEARWMWFNWDPGTIVWPTLGSPFIWPGGFANTTKDFLIFRLPVEAVTSTACEPKTQGFWKRQCASGKRPHPSGEAAELAGYVACVAATSTFGHLAEVAPACGELHPFPPSDKCQQAEAQFMALLLNGCSGRLSRGCCVDFGDGARTVGDVVDEIDGLLSSPTRTFSDCVLAQDLAAQINEDSVLCGVDAESCL